MKKITVKIELKYNQRLFLNWVLLEREIEIGKFNTTALGIILRNGYYDTSGEQRILNGFRSEYMQEYKEYEDGIAKMTYLTVK